MSVKGPTLHTHYIDNVPINRYDVGAFGDRLMVGQQTLNLFILVRIQVPEPCQRPSKTDGCSTKEDPALSAGSSYSITNPHSHVWFSLVLATFLCSPSYKYSIPMKLGDFIYTINRHCCRQLKRTVRFPANFFFLLNTYAFWHFTYCKNPTVIF